MNEKQQQLTFNKGITNIPSDALCDDNELDVSDGLVYRDGEHQPIQDPVKLCDDNGASKILCVHKVGSSENFIAYYATTYSIGFFVRNGGVSSESTTIVDNVEMDENMQIEAIGRTLVVKTGTDILYLLWDGVKYKLLGTRIPEPKVAFQTYSENITFHDWPAEGGIYHVPNTGTFLESSDSDPDGAQWVIGTPGEGYYGNSQTGPVVRNWYFIADGRASSEKYKDFQAYAIGKYSYVRNKLRKRGMFTDPFAVRFAVELYDGSYVNRSAPIILFPTVRKNEFMMIIGNIYWESTSSPSINNIKDVEVHDAIMYVRGADLQFKAQYDYEEWSDIVRGVTIFMTDFANVAKLDSDAFLAPYESLTSVDWVSEGVYHKDFNFDFSAWARIKMAPYSTIQTREDKDIVEELNSKEDFYELAQLKELRRADVEWVSIRPLLKENRLINPSSSYPSLGDGFYEKHKTTAEQIFSYNGRLILANLKRSFFEGYEQFIGYNGSTTQSLDVYVTISGISDGDRVIHRKLETSEQLQYYFYYPDPRAKRVQIFNGQTKIVDHIMEEHPHRNGAYFMEGLPDTVQPLNDTSSTRPAVNNEPEMVSNEMYVSEVDNPWDYKAEGSLKVGNGSIIAVSTNTIALSQGQFGQFPLVIFCTDGIYAASMNDEGKFVTVNPMSREVCNNPQSITQTDGAIFFTSSKGLMIIVGSDVRCVSQQMMGKFVNMLKNAKIAYDYRDSLLWIVPEVVNGVTSEDCWVYNIKSGTFHTTKYFKPIGADEPSTAYPFEGFTDDDYTDESYTPASLKEDLEDSLTPSFMYYSVLKYIVFKSDAKRFYELRIINYAFDTNQSYELKFLYENFENDNYYLDPLNNNEPLTSVCYENGGFVYLWNGAELNAQSYSFDGNCSPTEGWDFFNEAYNSDNLLAKINSGVGAGNVASINGNPIIRYAYHWLEKKFRLKAIVECTLNDSSVNTYVVYFLVPAGNYADQNGDPLVDTLYYNTSGDDYLYYRWDGTQRELLFAGGENPQFPTYKFDSEKSLSSIEVKAGAYNEEELQAQLLENAPDISVNDFNVVSENGFAFQRVDERFVSQVTYSYYYQGGKRYGARFFVTNDPRYVVAADDYHPRPDVLYLMNKSGYYRWVGESLQNTHAGLASVVNSYPDTLFQLMGDGIYSLMERPQPTDDENTYTGQLITRPMKLENALALKSIMQIRHIKSMDGTITMRIFASNNMKEWVELHSLRGIPWLYYKFSFVFSNMPATDRFAGTMLITQERRTNKMR